MVRAVVRRIASLPGVALRFFSIDFFSKIFYEYSNLEIVAGMIFDSNHLFQVVDWSLLTLPGLGTSYCNTSTSIDVRKIVCSHNRNSHVGIPSFLGKGHTSISDAY